MYSISNKKFGRTIYNMYKCIHYLIQNNKEMQREQLEQLLSSNSILRSTFLMLYLKEDNVEAFFTLLGTELHSKGCFPKETVLNLGIVKS